MTSPLEGTRVLDLSRYIAGPLCAQHLGDLGAEVIKVESPRGEEARLSFPVYEGFSLYFANFNRNKLGVTLNLRTDKGKQVLRELVACSDVLVQNFRVGVMEEMGMGYRPLAEINPRLVMVNVSGFGRESAKANWPAYDEIAQAMSGMMDLTGPKDGPPTLAGTYVVDHLAGMYATIGALAALEHRSRTGEGQEVDVSLLQSAASTLMTSIPWHLMTGREVTRNGNRHRLHAAINAYPARDGYIYVGAGRQHMWTKLAGVVGRPDLLEDPRFATLEARAANIDEVDHILGEWTSRHTRQEIAEMLSKAGVASGPVRRISEVVADPDFQGQGTVVEVEHPNGGTVSVMGNPVKLSKTPVEVRRSPPRVGEHNACVYGGLLGHSQAEIETWRSSGII